MLSRTSVGLVSLVAVAAGLLGSAPPPADASAAPAGRYSWDQAVVVVTSTASSTWGVGRAVRGWNAHRVLGQPRLVLRDDAVHPDVVVKAVRAPRHWWTGLATGSQMAGTLTGFEISLNKAAITKPMYRYGGSFAAAKRWTTSHELGHALGLEHSQHRTHSVMSYDNAWWRTEGRPGRYDFRQLSLLY